MTFAPETLSLALALLGTGCWGVCFWWMHRISTRQDSLLKELSEVAGRIERISQAEHDMVKEVHPAVSEIKKTVDDVEKAVEEKQAPTPAS